jgi:nitrile hydratase subunit alpha
MGFDVAGEELIAVENTETVHNIIVCTLCSCYPRSLLGLPPDWYKSRAYRSRTVREPRKVLAEFGLVLPDDVTVRVHDSTADMRYIVLPMRPAGTEALSEADLAALVTRDSMIGTGLPRRL